MKRFPEPSQGLILTRKKKRLTSQIFAMGANISHFNLLGKCTLFQDTEVIQIQKIELF